MFKRNSPAGIVLREPTPRRKVEFLGALQLRQIALQPRTLGQQPEDAVLVQNVDMILPDHIIDRGKPLPIADQRGRQARDAILHAVLAFSGSATA